MYWASRLNTKSIRVLLKICKNYDGYENEALSSSFFLFTIVLRFVYIEMLLQFRRKKCSLSEAGVFQREWDSTGNFHLRWKATLQKCVFRLPFFINLSLIIPSSCKCLKDTLTCSLFTYDVHPVNKYCGSRPYNHIGFFVLLECCWWRI